MIAALDLVRVGRTWLGVPFRHQGRARTGVDCAGFLVELMRAAGQLPLDFAAPAAYGRRPTGELRQIVERFCVRTGVPQPGVLVLLSWPPDPEPHHVALCTGPTLIHSYQRARAVVENGYRGPWVKNTHSLWQLPGVDYEAR